MTGLYAIQSLAAHAIGDDGAARAALGVFAAATRRARGPLELFQGLAGRLAGAAIVARSLPDPGVLELGARLAPRVVAAIESRSAPLAEGQDGVAHGWPGVVLGALAWQAVTGSLPRDALIAAVAGLHPYEVSALNAGRQVDWAHGHSGMATVFARAYATLGDPRFLRWAREAASRACALPASVPMSSVSVLSGTPGIAYGLLAVAAIDPAGPWRALAWRMAGRALGQIGVPAFAPYGVWSGLGGVCCLALDLLDDAGERFPGIES